MELKRALFKDLWGCWKHKFLEKIGKLSSEKILWPIFCRLIEYHRPQGTLYRGPQGFLTIIVQVKRWFLQDPEVENQIFQKKSFVPQKKSFRSFFSHFSHLADFEQQLFRLHKVSGNYGSSYKTIFSTPKILKTQFFQKAVLSVERIIGQPFPVLSNSTTLREQLIRVQKVTC